MLSGLLGLFLIAHGALHASYFTPAPDDPKYPFRLDRSWLMSGSGKSLGILLAVVTVIAFAVAGLSVLGVGGLPWKTAVIVGCVTSLGVLGLFWHPWLALGVVIDLVLLYGVLKLGWKLEK